MNDTTLPPLSQGDRFIYQKDLDALLCAFPEASDIFIKEDDYPIAKIHGRNRLLCARPLQSTELRELMTVAYESVSGYDGIKQTPSPKDFAYTALNGERFRVNVVRDMQSPSGSVAATFRRIAATPWTVTQANTPSPLLDVARNSTRGLIMVGGPTGSGKSALLSSVLRDLLENPENHHRLATVESPVEFTYRQIAARHNPVDQLEVGKSCESFADGIRAHLRMAPTLILVGEVRDAETAEACIWAAQSGHLVFATMHPGSVPELFSYWMRFFPAAMQSRMAYALASVLKFAICQHLVPSLDGRRTPIREWQDFNRLNRDVGSVPGMIADAGDRVFETVASLIADYGQPMKASARQLLDEGRISREVAYPFIF